MDLGLEDKVAIVTGGSDGIGKAAAIAMAGEGARVAVASRTAERLEAVVGEIEAAGGVAMAVPTDVREESQVRALVQSVVDRFGRLDIVVNNAGTSSAHAFESLTDAIFAEDFALKVYGAMFCIRAALPHLRAAGGGAIVNVTTPGGKAPEAGTNPTAMARAAGLSMTKSLSLEFAADNIRVNSVCIGLIKSGQHRVRWEARHADDPSYTLDDHWATMAPSIPLGRVGEAAEAGEVIAFLCSERASYVTGSAINIDGGSSPVL